MDITIKANTIKANLSEPLTRVQERAKRYIVNYKPLTIWDLRRLIEMVKLYELSIDHVLNDENELDQLLGACVELGSHRPHSNIIRVRSKNDSDSYIKFSDREKSGYRLEVKTNGGMVQDLFKLQANTRTAKIYLHYYLDTNVKPTKKNPSGLRQIEFVTTLDYFLEVLMKYNAITSNPYHDNDFTKAINIRPDNAKMFKHFTADLQNGVVMPFDRRMTYCLEDFEE